MAFVVETGDGADPLANSFVSLVEADAYFVDRNNTDWAGYTDEEKQATLIYATGYLNNLLQWYGSLVATTQPLSWPRSEFIDSEGRTVETLTVPKDLKNATCELAYQDSVEGLNTVATTGVASEKIGSSSITYANGGGHSPSRSFAFVKSMVKHLGITGASSTSNIYRG